MENTQAYNQTSKMTDENEQKKGEIKMNEIAQKIEANELTTSKVASLIASGVDASELSRKVIIADMMTGSLKEAFKCAMDEYTIETAVCARAYTECSATAQVVLTLRALDGVISQRYLDGKISGGEFDHMRVWIGIHAYHYYEHVIEEVDMDEFFLEASIKASEKFTQEVDEMKREKVILQFVEDGWEYKYGTLSFKVRDDMTIADYKTTKQTAIDQLKEAGIEVSDYDSSINFIVLDLSINGQHLEGYSDDGYYFSTGEEYDEFLRQTDV